ncbi:guanine nucleotide binding protein (G protein) alpha v1 [Nothobranchius furzeri]
MNKNDLFQDKMLHHGQHLRLYLSPFKGDVDSAACFIATTFVLLNRTPNKIIYCHFTTATDMSNVHVFQVVMDTITRDLEAVNKWKGPKNGPLVQIHDCFTPQKVLSIIHLYKD